MPRRLKGCGFVLKPICSFEDCKSEFLLQEAKELPSGRQKPSKVSESQLVPVDSV